MDSSEHAELIAELCKQATDQVEIEISMRNSEDGGGYFVFQDDRLTEVRIIYPLPGGPDGILHEVQFWTKDTGSFQLTREMESRNGKLRPVSGQWPATEDQIESALEYATNGIRCGAFTAYSAKTRLHPVPRRVGPPTEASPV